MTRRIYIAGPMTGLPELNYPAFHAAAANGRRQGWDALNPAEAFGGDTTREYRDYMRADLKMLAEADAIAFLPGWTDSRGARFEYSVALMLGLAMYDALTFAPLTQRAA